MVDFFFFGQDLGLYKWYQSGLSPQSIKNLRNNNMSTFGVDHGLIMVFVIWFNYNWALNQVVLNLNRGSIREPVWGMCLVLN